MKCGQLGIFRAYLPHPCCDTDLRRSNMYDYRFHATWHPVNLLTIVRNWWTDQCYAFMSKITNFAFYGRWALHIPLLSQWRWSNPENIDVCINWTHSGTMVIFFLHKERIEKQSMIRSMKTSQTQWKSTNVFKMLKAKCSFDWMIPFYRNRT